MRKRIFLAVSTSDLATRNRIFFPPCRIRSTALKPSAARGGWSQDHVALQSPLPHTIRTGDAAMGHPGKGNLPRPALGPLHLLTTQGEARAAGRNLRPWPGPPPGDCGLHVSPGSRQQGACWPGTGTPCGPRPMQASDVRSPESHPEQSLHPGQGPGGWRPYFQLYLLPLFNFCVS